MGGRWLHDAQNLQVTFSCLTNAKDMHDVMRSAPDSSPVFLARREIFLCSGTRRGYKYQVTVTRTQGIDSFVLLLLTGDTKSMEGQGRFAGDE